MKVCFGSVCENIERRIKSETKGEQQSLQLLMTCNEE